MLLGLSRFRKGLSGFIWVFKGFKIVIGVLKRFKSIVDVIKGFQVCFHDYSGSLWCCIEKYWSFDGV